MENLSDDPKASCATGSTSPVGQRHSDHRFDVISRNPDRLDLFVTGTDRRIYSTWWTPRDRLRIHVKVLSEPTTISRAVMVQSMIDLYASVGIDVVIASVETLNLPLLNDVDVGACETSTTAEQNQLFANRNNAGANDLCVYFVRSTVPPLNGCAAFPANRPGAVVTSIASPWTLAHECGHVIMGPGHVADTNRLMMGGGTWNITNPPPDLIQAEVDTMRASLFT